MDKATRYDGYRHIIYPEKSGKERVNKVAIVERIDAWIDERWQMVGHSHIQRADAILELKPRLGDKLEFSCEVFEYAKTNAQGEAYTGIGLSNSDKVSCIQLAPSIIPALPPTPPPAPVTPTPAPALAVLRRIKEIGTEALKRVVLCKLRLATTHCRRACNCKPRLATKHCKNSSNS